MTSDPAAKDGRGHTPGPWKICEREFNSGWYISRTIYSTLADGTPYRVADASPLNPDDQANARRIVAAVNACEGVPIAELEDLAALKCNLPSVAGVAQMAILNDDLESDRTRLRERVKELENALQKIANHDGVSEIIARVALSKSPK